eukprot:GHVO01039414.1.p1 GENE.GHVO01039414.1~~GHVO01039414.1.p1  ORF type:complete len:158 (-),score=7.12 GHVO01039414.1:169-621(-)
MFKIIPPHICIFGVILQGACWYFAPILSGYPPYPLNLFIGPILAVTGFFLTRHCIRLLDSHGTAHNIVDPCKTVVTDWPFSVTRNPTYIGLLMIVAGFGILFSNMLGLVVSVAILFSAVHWYYIPYEEAKIRRDQPKAYKLYTERVPRWV